MPGCIDQDSDKERASRKYIRILCKGAMIYLFNIYYRELSWYFYKARNSE